METEQISERKCNCCGEILPATDFPKYPNGKPRSVCLRCRKKKEAEKYRQESGCSRPYSPRINLLIPLPNERVRELYCNQKNYYVTSLGRVGYKGVDGKVYLYSLHKNQHGYVTFHSNRRYMVHRLVVMAFIGEIPKGMEVNHINGIRDDNRVENLEIVTPQENVRHSIYVLGHKARGRNKKNNKSSRPVLCYSSQGEFIERFPSVSETARQLKCKVSNVQGVCSGKRRTYRGLLFRYEDNSNTVTLKKDKKGPCYIISHRRCDINENIFFTKEELGTLRALIDNVFKER